MNKPHKNQHAQYVFNNKNQTVRLLKREVLIIGSQIIEQLAKNALFEGLNLHDLEDLLPHTTYNQLKQDDVIFNKGDKSNDLFLIISGRVKIQNQSEDGKTLIHDMLNPNSFFGELGLIENKPRVACAVCLSDCTIASISRSYFLTLINKHPIISLKVMAKMSNSLRNTNEFLENIVFFNLATRLAKLLRVLARKYGKDTADGIDFDIKISQVELSNLVGSSRESVNKQLKKWEEEGKIKMLENGRMFISKDLV